MANLRKQADVTHDIEPPARPLKLVSTSALARSTPDQCISHGGNLQADGPDMGIVVGWIDLGSGPGHWLLACHTCVAYHGLMRLIDHPADTDCLPRYHDADSTAPRPAQ